MRNSKGYMLVELLAVIVIMGIITGIAVPVYVHFMEKYKRDLCKVNRVRWLGCMMNI